VFKFTLIKKKNVNISGGIQRGIPDRIFGRIPVKIF